MRDNVTPELQPQYQTPSQPQYYQPAPAPQQPVVVNVVNNNENVNANNIGGFDDRDRKSKWVAFFLCLILGVIGAHNFYCGKVGMGLLYLVTVGFCGIGVIIDLIRILTGSYRDKWGRALR